MRVFAALHLPPRQPLLPLATDTRSYLASAGISVPIIEYRLRGRSIIELEGPDSTQGRALTLENATAVHAALLSQQHLGHISSCQQILECAPELLGCVHTDVRKFIVTLRALSFKPHHTTALFVTLREHPGESVRIVELPTDTIHARHEHLGSILALRGPPLASFLSYHPRLLLIEEQQVAASASWLHNILEWEGDALRRAVKTWGSEMLLQSSAALHETASYLQSEMDLSLEELHYMLRCAPCLLGYDSKHLKTMVKEHRKSFMLVAAVYRWRGEHGEGRIAMGAQGSASVDWSLEAQSRPLASQMKQLNVLYLLSSGMNCAQVADLESREPTAMRRPLWVTPPFRPKNLS